MSVSGCSVQPASHMALQLWVDIHDSSRDELVAKVSEDDVENTLGSWCVYASVKFMSEVVRACP